MPNEKPPGLLSRYRNGLAELRQPGQIAGGARNYMAGLLAQTPTQNIQQAAAMGIPGASDVAGLLADGMMYNSSPESRTPANYLLSALGALPFVPGVTAFHGSPVAGIDKFDRLAPRDLPGKADRLDSVGTWFAASKEDAAMFGKNVYEADVKLKNPAKYFSWNDLVEDFNRVVRGRKPRKGEVAAVAKDGGNKFHDFLKSKGHDGIVVYGDEGIDATRSQTYYVAFDPEQVKITK